MHLLVCPGSSERQNAVTPWRAPGPGSPMRRVPGSCCKWSPQVFEAPFMLRFPLRPPYTTRLPPHSRRLGGVGRWLACPSVGGRRPRLVSRALLPPAEESDAGSHRKQAAAPGLEHSQGHWSRLFPLFLPALLLQVCLHQQTQIRVLEMSRCFWRERVREEPQRAAFAHGCLSAFARTPFSNGLAPQETAAGSKASMFVCKPPGRYSPFCIFMSQQRWRKAGAGLLCSPRSPSAAGEGWSSCASLLAGLSSECPPFPCHSLSSFAAGFLWHAREAGLRSSLSLPWWMQPLSVLDEERRTDWRWTLHSRLTDWDRLKMYLGDT
nr:uncharacterized protein LOC112987340 [Dromaius novaehollandiae]